MNLHSTQIQKLTIQGFGPKTIKPGKGAVMYTSVRGIDFISISMIFLLHFFSNCFNYVVFCDFKFSFLQISIKFDLLLNHFRDYLFPVLKTYHCCQLHLPYVLKHLYQLS